MSDIGAAEVSFLPRVPRLKIASTVAIVSARALIGARVDSFPDAETT